MSIKKPISDLGYHFISEDFIPKGKDEYYLRNIQNRNGILYRALTKGEITALEKNGNQSDNWNMVMVSDPFHPQLVKNCNFFGLVRFGKLEPYFLEHHDIRLPVGIYNSTIISCDFGDNVAVNNVSYMSHYIAGNEVILVNIQELATSNHSKFGNGIIKKGEKESVRIKLEICNENAGRSIMPFNGMLASDAYLWSRHRADEVLMDQFRIFTENKFDKKRGYYGKIGDSTVIKNCGIIKDVWIGEYAYIKGSNKLKNLTINSSEESKTQIGEGCELVNGIIGSGCRIFYGVKAVRFFLAAHSQLKYGARLINSYLGENSTISCCEVLNSLIFPAHEQHHNNSFLCAALIMGQSNMAAGATIGSNHNSRSADGELIAGRGFWPGLCVSLKHNSRFACFTIIAKGDFPAELNIPFPFSLVSHDVANDRIVIMPAYWFMYNMFALARNESKYLARDKRISKDLYFEYDFLAPDSVNEIFDSIHQLKEITAGAFVRHTGQKLSAKQKLVAGEKLLEGNDAVLNELEFIVTGIENSKRKVILTKVPQAYRIYKELVVYYGINQLLLYAEKTKPAGWEAFYHSLPLKSKRSDWINAGGQLIPAAELKKLIRLIHKRQVNSWDEVHEFYKKKSLEYQQDKLQHAFASLMQISGITPEKFSAEHFKSLVQKAIITREWMVKNIYSSRAKDYQNPFRKMVYETNKEMNAVLGKLNENSFIREQKQEMKEYRQNAGHWLKRLCSGI